MNKKNLSVVMAGAMLATSVAPVLADSTEVKKYELASENTGLLMSGLRNLFEEKVFHSTDKNLANKSVYYFTVDGNTEKKRVENLKELRDLTPGQKVYVWDEGHRVDNYGNYFSTTGTTTDGDVVKYTKEELINAYRLISEDSSFDGNKDASDDTISASFPTIKYVSYEKESNKLTVVTGADLTFTKTIGDEVLNFTKPLDENGVALPNIADSTPKVKGYEVIKGGSSTDADIKGSKVAEIKITKSTTDYKVEELYDGLMLTVEGHDLLTRIKDAKKATIKNLSNNEIASVSDVDSKISSSYGVSGFKVELTDKFNKTVVHTITGLDLNNTKTLAKWLVSREPKVDILAGDNRYETAVKISKEVSKIDEIAKNGGNIVLVNGNSLVDGLSAAPLAARLSTTKSGTSNAPILLTEADKLPTATADYLRELVKSAEVGKLKDITINIVGGESVVSENLEAELEKTGFKVVRFGGDNREETSLAVAERIMKNPGMADTTDEVFVVGANGEADAMSIAPVASTTTGGENARPIIVTNNNGITKDALKMLDGKKVTVVGGEGSVSASDYNKIEDAVGENGAVRRIAGKDRKATNAAIIEEYYGVDEIKSGKVVVAKDGMKNKSELIDALAATTLAAKDEAPLVLATDKLSNDQINALERNADKADSLYQIGLGVNRNVVLTVAQRLGLAK